MQRCLRSDVRTNNTHMIYMYCTWPHIQKMHGIEDNIDERSMLTFIFQIHDLYRDGLKGEPVVM